MKNDIAIKLMDLAVQEVESDIKKFNLNSEGLIEQLFNSIELETRQANFSFGAMHHTAQFEIQQPNFAGCITVAVDDMGKELIDDAHGNWTIK